MPRHLFGPWFSVNPRHTCGSPAAVDEETAARVAQEEVGAFARYTTWGRGFDPDATAVADQMGLAGIVYRARADRRKVGLYQVEDVITGWVGPVQLGAYPGERLTQAVWRVQGNVQSPADLLMPVYTKQAER